MAWVVCCAGAPVGDAGESAVCPEKSPPSLTAVPRRTALLLAAGTLAAQFGHRTSAPVPAVEAAEKNSSPPDFYSLQPDQNGAPFPLQGYRGKVTLVVNVATYCALTPQYSSLVELYDRYEKRGFEVIAFPCNQFGAQEPGSRDEICDFAKQQFGARFEIMDKVDVNGPKASQTYRFLKSKNPDSDTRIEWNFAKFLVDQDGFVVRRYKPGVDPLDISKDVDVLLNTRVLPPRKKPQLGVV